MSYLKTFVPHIFTDLQSEVIKRGNTSVTIRHRDIHFILSDKALSDLDSNAVKQFLAPLTMPSKEQLDASCDDATLNAFCKSRYIQQASDVQEYANSLKNFSNNLSKYAKILKRSEDDSSKTATSTPSPSPSQSVSEED